MSSDQTRPRVLSGIIGGIHDAENFTVTPR